MIIILAPHLLYPLRNGGDIYIERIGCHLSAHRAPVFILGANTLTCYEMGAKTSQSHFLNNLRTKPWAAIRTLAFNSHYLIEKFLTNAYRQKARELVLEYPEAVIIYSCISTASLELTKDPAIVITQNDEVAFYRNLQVHTKNPLQKSVAAQSEKWVLNFLRHSKNNYIYAHISETDQEAYSNYVLQHKSILVPAGVEPRSSFPLVNSQDKKIHLLFCGSLSAQMNLDALLFFKEKIWGLLKNYFQEAVDVWVAGSHPTSSVINLCKSQGWALYPDISDEDLNSLYEQATFGILPFEYSAGAKIKLLNSLAAGLPVLATTSVKNIPEQDFLPNLFSNDPQKWLEHLQKYRITKYDISGRIVCQQFAMQYSWQKIAEKMDSDLKSMGI